MTVLPLGFLGDFVSGGRSNLIGVIPARFRLWKNETKTRLSFHDLERSFEDLRRLERVFRCRGVCETMEDYKEGYLMVWTNYMSTCRSIVGLYFKGTCDVISVTMATYKVHKSVL